MASNHKQVSSTFNMTCTECHAGACWACVDVIRRRLGRMSDICQCVRKDHLHEVEKAMPDRIEIWKSHDGQYYWHMVNGGNNKIVFVGGEGFHNTDDIISLVESYNYFAKGDQLCVVYIFASNSRA